MAWDDKGDSPASVSQWCSSAEASCHWKKECPKERETRRRRLYQISGFEEERVQRGELEE